MTRTMTLLLVLLAGALGLSSCTREDSHDGHDHGPGAHEHPGTKDPGDDAADNDHGPPHELGSLGLASFTADVTQYGELEAGHEGVFRIEITSGDAVENVRVWVGDEKATGAVKSKAEQESDGSFHAHVELGANLAAEAMLWVEIEAAGGAREKAALKPHRE